MEPLDLELLERRLRALFEHDERGRIHSRRGAGAAPLFLLARTREGTLWRFNAELGEQAVLRLARLAGREPSLDATETPPERVEPMRRALSTQGSGEIGIVRLRVHRLRARPNARHDDESPWIAADWEDIDLRERSEREQLPLLADEWYFG